jgi:hypothetical protein
MKKDAQPMEKKYDDDAACLSDVIRQFAGQRSLPEAVAQIAHEIQVSIHTVDSWRRGVRRIPEKKIEPLVQALCKNGRRGELAAAARELARTLRKLRRDRKPEDVRSWKERIEKGDSRLAVRHARYEGAGRLWGRIFYPFLDAAYIKYTDPAPGGRRTGRTDPWGRKPHKDFHQLQAEVYKGNLDVALGILATPRLSLKLWFFNSPIHWRVNCVALAEDVEAIGGEAEVRRILALRPNIRKRYTQQHLVPILMEGEVGEAYARRNLAFEESIKVKSLDAKEFSSTLAATKSRTGRYLPFAIVDEVTCLRILINLEGRGRLIFPLVPDHTDHSAPIPPSFPLGMCVSRNERLGHAKKSELMTFIRDGLTTYINGNALNIAFYYLALRNQIKRLVETAMPEYSKSDRDEWLEKSFRLRPEYLNVLPPHWRAVLQEALVIDGRTRPKR